MIRWLVLFCTLAAAHCESFHANQHLPLQNFQSPWRYHQPSYPASASAAASSKNDYSGQMPHSGNYNDLLRQYQQWQIAVPNQQQGGVVWISAPIYGQNPPQNAPGYPPAPPSGSTHGSPSSGSPTHPDTIVRDTVVTTGDEEPYSPTIATAPPTQPTTSASTWDSSTSTSESTTYTSTTSAPTSTDQSTTTAGPNGTTQSPTNSSNPLLKYCAEPRGQFADPCDCSKFINCWDGTAFEQSCPSGLVFNAEKKYCDYAQNVNCSGTNQTTSNPPTNPPTSTENSTLNNPNCPSYYGTFRNKTNCAAFYVCVYGEPVDFICPTGTNYNDNLGVCDYEDRVDCKGAPSTAAAITTTSTESNNASTTESWSTSTTAAPQPTWSSSETSVSTTSEATSTSAATSEPTTTTTTTTTSTTPEQSSWPAPPPVQPEGTAPPGVDPIGLYNFNLKKLPESIVNTGVRCYHPNSLFRLTPDCSSVTICNEGLTYIVNCGQTTSFDAYSQRCVHTSTARC